MSPLVEESNPYRFSQSLPDLQPNSALNTFDENDSSDVSRRYTVTVVDLKANDKKKLEVSHSAPSNLEKPSTNQSSLTKLPVVRSVSDRPLDKSDSEGDTLRRKRWTTANLLKSRRRDASLSSTVESRPTEVRSERSLTELPPIAQKPKTKSGKLFSRIGKMSPKSRSNSLRTGPSTSVQSSPSKPQKKKQSRFFSFRSGSPLKSPKKNLSDFNENSSNDNSATQIIAFDDSDDPAVENEKQVQSKLRRKPSKKIVEISKRLTDDVANSSRSQPNPAPISEGIVSRLSKRFVRTDKENDSDKSSISAGSYSKNANVLSAKNRFEKRAFSDSKTSTFPRTAKHRSKKVSTPPLTRRMQR